MKAAGVGIILVVGSATLCGGAGCRPDDQRTESVNPEAGRESRQEFPPEVVAQLDSGNAAYEGGDFAEARRHYREAVRLDPEATPAWFGVYMAEKALGNDEAADSALRRVQSRAPGASLVHPPG
jgi:tetratricopeptide (TPR) repeat protein